MIPFNKPFIAGNEISYIQQAIENGKISGNGIFTQKCQHFFESRFGLNKVLLTSSCTDALEMAAILSGIQPGDEVIMPSFTFVSAANAFIMRGARIVFVDSNPDEPNMQVATVERYITERTKVIIAAHYGGIATDMLPLLDIAIRHDLLLIEDAATCIGATYRNIPLGSIGHMATFSFHETKNIISGEGGMLVINDERFCERAEIIWEKGTDRAAFARGEIQKYNWVDIGSSFLPSEIMAAYLFGQLEHLDAISEQRADLWKQYYAALKPAADKGIFHLPAIPDFAGINYHVFPVICSDAAERNALIGYLREQGIMAVFHYQSLHKSPYFSKHYTGPELPNSDHFSATLVRLPLYHTLGAADIEKICSAILSFYNRTIKSADVG